MQAQRILKLYFIFVLSIVVAGGLGNFSEFKEYIRAAAYFYDLPGNVRMADAREIDKTFENKAILENVFAENNPHEVFINFTNTAGGAYGFAGQEKVKVMDINFKTTSGDLLLNKIKFMVHGVDPDMIERVYLMEGEKELGTAVNRNGEFSFSKLEYVLGMESEGFLTLKADLGKELRSSDRIRFDIKGKDSIEMVVGNLPYIYQDLPLKGKYLSVVRVRK